MRNSSWLGLIVNLCCSLDHATELQKEIIRRGKEMIYERKGVEIGELIEAIGSFGRCLENSSPPEWEMVWVV